MRAYCRKTISLAAQVPVSSSIVHAAASNTSSETVEISSNEKDEKNNMADALSKKRETDTSPSLEEFQNLAGGADIKVLLSWLLYEAFGVYYFILLFCQK